LGEIGETKDSKQKQRKLFLRAFSEYKTEGSQGCPG